MDSCEFLKLVFDISGDLDFPKLGFEFPVFKALILALFGDYLIIFTGLKGDYILAILGHSTCVLAS
jgi:hypothetical protein